MLCSGSSSGSSSSSPARAWLASRRSPRVLSSTHAFRSCRDAGRQNEGGEEVKWEDKGDRPEGM